MTNTAQCPPHSTGHGDRNSRWYSVSSAVESPRRGLSWKSPDRAIFRFMLALLVAVAGTGCASIRALWQGEHYVITLLQVADGRFAQERLFRVLSPDGVPVKCKVTPVFTSRDIVAAERVMEGKSVVGLRLTLTPENHLRWMQVGQELRDGAIAVIVDDYSCLVVSPVTSTTFSEPNIIQLTGTFDSSLLDPVVKHAETNYKLKKMKEWR